MVGVSGNDGHVSGLEASVSVGLDSVASLPGRSDGSSSLIEEEPLLSVGWEAGLDLEIVSVTTDVLVDDESSSVSSVVLELEQDVVTQWVSSVQSSLLV